MKVRHLEELERACMAATEGGVKFDRAYHDTPGLTGEEMALIGKIAAAIAELRRINKPSEGYITSDWAQWLRWRASRNSNQ